MPATAELEIGLHRQEADRYWVELRSRPAGSDADMAPVRGTTTLDPEALRAAAFEGPEAVGKALGELVFADPIVRDHYASACVAAEAADADLRVRLFVGPTAPELNALRWETIHDPRRGSPIATRGHVLFSRMVGGSDWRPVRLRPEGLLRALVVVANPSDLASYKMAPVRVDEELRRAREAMGDIPVVEVTGPDTLARLGDRLREEVDILYVVAHGALHKEEPVLWLESAAGTTARASGRTLVELLGNLARAPRLVVLASCQGAGDGEGRGSLSALGPRLAEAGIPAVVAMQGDVSMATVEQFMPVFFRELRRDGRVDRATAVARWEVKDRPDAWTPVLFLRLTSGRIWYDPGFSRGPDQEFDLWRGLITYLRPQRPKGTPILGSGLLDPYLGPTHEFARRWAERNFFPLASHAREDLPRVAQFLSVSFRASALRDMFEQELRTAVRERLGGPKPGDDAGSLGDLLCAMGRERRKANPHDPHRALAELPFSLYLTTNPDRLLVDALREAGKTPEVGLCPWSEKVDWSGSVFEREPDFRPTVDRPLVYHLFGRLEDLESLVLTEDDYFDYLIGATRQNEMIPTVVRSALVNSALLFMGFSLDDWDFRVLFRILMAQGGRDLSHDYAHVAVQVDPEEGRNVDPDGARRYLSRYFENEDIRIYWGHVEDFAGELIDRWSRGQAPNQGGGR